MAQKYYLDACIWKDYFENRSDNFRPLGDWAFRLITKIVTSNDLFVFSDRLIRELETQYSSEELNKLFSIIPESLIIRLETNKAQAKEAFELKNRLKIPFGDALHAIHARDSNSILVSRDKHFHELTEQIVLRKPEDLI